MSSLGIFYIYAPVHVIIYDEMVGLQLKVQITIALLLNLTKYAA